MVVTLTVQANQEYPADDRHRELPPITSGQPLSVSTMRTIGDNVASKHFIVLQNEI